MEAKPPKAMDLTCVSALGLGPSFGRLFWTPLIWTFLFGHFYFWTCDLDVLTPGTSSTRHPDVLDLLFIYIFQPTILCKYNFKKFHIVYLKLVRVLVSPLVKSSSLGPLDCIVWVWQM